MLQLYDLCRLCAQKKRNKVDLFTGLNDEEDRDFLAKISLCVSVQVTREDLLPKMVCVDCQKAVEQFNAFRIKCLKAEERLNKMLSLALPNKLTVTRIKQECLETDFQDNTHPKQDSPNPFGNLKSLKNVKLEIEEPDNETFWNQNVSSDLIQIISEEIVNQQCLLDIKQPQIEIISENYNEDCKHLDLNENDEICDIKVIPEILPITEEIFDNNIQSVEVETTIKTGESDEEIRLPQEEKKTKSKRKSIIRHRIMSSEYEIDEKYLTLNEGEFCDIDLEEMDALIKKKQNPNTTFSCNKCKKTFKFFKCLKKHKQAHESEPQVFICDFCKSDNLKNFEFCSLKSLKNHILRKHLMADNKKYVCEECKRVLPSQGQLNSHMRRVHSNCKVPCQTCGKIFKNKTRLVSHLKVHQELKSYVCDQCGRSFKWSNALKVHMQWHKQEKNFLCSECGKKFTAKKNLLEHLNIHTGKRPFVCDVCSASFVQISSYSKHIYLHNEEKRLHKCDKCGKKYRYVHLLKQHLISHTGIRPYECSTCHRTFKFQSSLCCHVKVHDDKQYECKVCGTKFSLLSTLKVHMVRHTGVKHKCPMPDCGKTYTQRFSLTKHFWKHHPTYTLERKKSGKKIHQGDDEIFEKGSLHFVQYNFKDKSIDIV